MTEPAPPPVEDPVARAASLEQRLAELEQTSRARLVRAELRTEAVRAGMVDLDGIKLIDTSALAFNKDGELADAAGVMRTFAHDKPWLFGAVSTSSAATPPNSAPPRTTKARDMTADEYRAARAILLKRR
jgi:hypothetical protein